MTPGEDGHLGGGHVLAYRHPGTGDTWVLHPDDAGTITLDARVVGLILESAGYTRVDE